MEGQMSWLCNPIFHSYHVQCSFTEHFLQRYQWFSSEERYIYTRLARKVIHYYINVTFSHILIPFPNNFLRVSLTVVRILLLESFALFVDFILSWNSREVTRTLFVRMSPSWKDVQVVYPAHIWNYWKLISWRIVRLWNYIAKARLPGTRLGAVNISHDLSWRFYHRCDFLGGGLDLCYK